ncbi:hypothetical protein [Jiulongibacter sp. NS-SX5]|uniref:hypothetical protein n=1 Tax=Jiulongibacter sp. NS-SX5 TaxID=3463854 RepID=UPI004058D2E0
MKAKIKKTVLFALLFMASKWSIILLLYHSDYWSYWFLLLFPIADFIAAIAAIIYLKGNFKRYFAAEIESLFPKKHKSVLAAIDARYETILHEEGILKKSENPLDKRLNLAGYFLAFIQEMEGRNLEMDEIKNKCLRIAKAYTKPKNKLHGWFLKMGPNLMRLPYYDSYLRKLNNRVSHKKQPLGFRAEILSGFDKTNLRFKVNVLECGISKLFRKKEVKPYESIILELDQLTTQLGGLNLKNISINKEIQVCDFTYQHS